MATAAWLDEHPKVLAYLSKALYQKLEAYQASVQLSMSKTIEKVLTEFLNHLEMFASTLPAADSGLQVESADEADAECLAATEQGADLEAQPNAVTTQLRKMAEIIQELMERVALLESPNQLAGGPLQESTTHGEICSLPVAPAVDHPCFLGTPTLDRERPDQTHDTPCLPPVEFYGNDFPAWMQGDGAVEPPGLHPFAPPMPLPPSPQPRGVILPAQEGQSSRSETRAANPLMQSWGLGSTQPRFSQSSAADLDPQLTTLDAPLVADPVQSAIDPVPLEPAQPIIHPKPIPRMGQGNKQLPLGKQPDIPNTAAQPPKQGKKKQPWWNGLGFNL